jgi:hypothetical protein
MFKVLFISQLQRRRVSGKPIGEEGRFRDRTLVGYMNF